MNPRALEMIAKARSELSSLCNQFGVKKLELIGSALTPDWDPEESDFDFVADFGPPPAGVDLFAQQFVLQVELEKLFGVKVDLIDRSAVSKPLFLERIQANAREIYAA